MISAVTFFVSHDDTTDALQDFMETTEREYASGDITMMQSSVKVDLPVKWFVNECCDVYHYPEQFQAEHFPNDFHRAFDTEAEAAKAAEEWNRIHDLLRPLTDEEVILCTLCKYIGLGHDGDHLVP